MKKIQLPLKVDPAIKEALQAAANEHSNGKLSAYTESVLKQHVSKKDFKHMPKREVYNKPKPIFCVGVDKDSVRHTQQLLEAKIGNDYRVIAYGLMAHLCEKPIFNLYNVHDEKPIDLEELRTLLTQKNETGI